MFYLDELSFLTEEMVSLSTLYIENVSIDSRTIKSNGLYIPIVGENNDGHSFILDAIKNGAVAAIWDKTVDIPPEVPYDFEILLVSSTSEALHQLARFYREKVNPTIIGITGSNGKTTTKDITHHILSQFYHSHKSPGNLNNHYGVPITLLSMPKNTEVCIVEMGMSNLGEIDKLSKLVKPDFAVITNIGDSHLAQLKSRENIAKAKSEIKNGMSNKGILIYDGDEYLLRNTYGIPIGLRKGESRLEIVEKNQNSVRFEFRGNHYSIPLIGEHNVKNTAFAIEIATRMNINPLDIKSRLESLIISNMRMEQISGTKDSTLINDAYNASPTSMKASIHTINDLNNYHKKILVLGDMLELGIDEERLHREVAHHIGPSISYVITVGEKARWIAEEIHKIQLTVKIDEVATPKEAAEKLYNVIDKDTIVLVKASRGMKLEEVIAILKR